MNYRKFKEQLSKGAFDKVRFTGAASRRFHDRSSDIPMRLTDSVSVFPTARRFQYFQRRGARKSAEITPTTSTAACLRRR